MTRDPLLTSILSHCIIVPKLTRLQRQYRGSSESITFPSSSTSTSITSLVAPAAVFLLAALALFFFGAAFLLPTALFPPEFVLLITPGAGRLDRLLAGLEEGWSGAGVFRAVLARRGRSTARDDCCWGSWLVAFPRDAGRRVVVVPAASCCCASDSATGVTAATGVVARVGEVDSSFSCSCLRAAAFLVSRTGGRIGVVDFLGDDARGRGMEASTPDAPSFGGELTTPAPLGAGEVTDVVATAAGGGWLRPGIGTGMGVVDCGPTTVPPGVSCVRGPGASWEVAGCDTAVVLGVSCG